MQRPNCCSITEAPVEPRAYVVASSRGLELSSQATALPEKGSWQPAPPAAIASSPPFTESVFAKKADLRI
jgi:hypothetical protein